MIPSHLFINLLGSRPKKRKNVAKNLINIFQLLQFNSPFHEGVTILKCQVLDNKKTKTNRTY